MIDAFINYNDNNDNANKIIPDLFTCDESHNLVSSDNDVKTATKIFGENFNPNKYLFMTATPLKIITRNRNEDHINNDIVFSMSNINLYG